MNFGSIHLRPMTAADLAIGMRLKQQAQWNQLEADWLRFMALQPDGCFIAEVDGVPVGTAVGLLFANVGWIAMMLVDPAVRGRGVGKALFAHALEFLESRGASTIRLDATDLGRPLYEKFGFVAEHRLARYEGRLRADIDSDGVSDADEADLEAIVRLDHAATGTDRQKLIRRLMQERAEPMRVVRGEGGLEGYLTTRPGSRALFIGPCVARGEAGPVLFRDAFRRYAGKRVFMDILESNAAASELAAAHGLTVQRRFLRMRRGDPVPERIEELWASSGPEKG